MKQIKPRVFHHPRGPSNRSPPLQNKFRASQPQRVQIIERRGGLQELLIEICQQQSVQAQAEIGSKIGILIAGNSGRPAGAVGLGNGRVDHSKVHVGHRTQEEDIISSWLTFETGCFQSDIDQDREFPDRIRYQQQSIDSHGGAGSTVQELPRETQYQQNHNLLPQGPQNTLSGSSTQQSQQSYTSAASAESSLPYPNHPWDTLFHSTIDGVWGLINTHEQAQDGMTIQGIDYKTTTDPQSYDEAWSVRNCTIGGKRIVGSGYRGEVKFEWDNNNSPEKIAKNVNLVFVAGPNAGACTFTRQGQGKYAQKQPNFNGSTFRTLNNYCQTVFQDTDSHVDSNESIDQQKYEFFRKGVAYALRRGLDAMIEQDCEIALLAKVSCGIYAGAYKNQINKDFEAVVNTILAEDYPIMINKQVVKRGQLFRSVILPVLPDPNNPNNQGANSGSHGVTAPGQIHVDMLNTGTVNTGNPNSNSNSQFMDFRDNPNPNQNNNHHKGGGGKGHGNHGGGHHGKGHGGGGRYHY